MTAAFLIGPVEQSMPCAVCVCAVAPNNLPPEVMHLRMWMYTQYVHMQGVPVCAHACAPGETARHELADVRALRLGVNGD